MGEAMLIAQPAKRDNVPLLDRQLRFDICENDGRRGGLVFNPKTRHGAITVDNANFVAARLSAQPDEVLFQALLRLMRGAPKPPANPFALRDADGRVLALAEGQGQSFLVARGNESYSLRKPGIFKRLFELYPHEAAQSLGTVGQAKFFTRRLQIDLPSSLPAAFQIFLLTLVLDLGLQNMNSGST